MTKFKDKAIEEICAKSTCQCGSFLRLAVLGIVFLNTKKTFYRYGLGVCVYQISGLYNFSL